MSKRSIATIACTLALSACTATTQFNSTNSDGSLAINDKAPITVNQTQQAPLTYKARAGLSFVKCINQRKALT